MMLAFTNGNIRTLTQHFHFYSKPKISPRKYRELSSIAYTLFTRHYPNVWFHTPSKGDQFMAQSWQKQFVKINLQNKHKQALQEFDDKHGNDVVQHLEPLTASGYKITIRWNDTRGAFSVSAVGTENSSRNQSSTMTSWSDDLHEAIAMTHFKDAIICDGGEWSDYAQDENWG